VQTLQAQTIMWPPAIVTAISALINIPVNLILIKLYGFTGAAAAFSVTRVIMFLLLVGEAPSLAIVESARVALI
jgi:O-antigen/teichoic acid export membrane protein